MISRRFTLRIIGSGVIPPRLAVPRKQNKQTLLRPHPFGRKPERNSIVRWFSGICEVSLCAVSDSLARRIADMIRTLNVRGLSLPDRTRVVAQRRPIGCSYLFIARWSEGPHELDDVFVT
jgi:hypothetical protein